MTFVADVLLFIPRFLINGIKGFFSKEESESEELVEEFNDKDESEKPEATEEKSSSEDKPVEEQKQEETKVGHTTEKSVEVTEEPQKTKKSSKKASAKNTTTKVEKVSAEVIDSQTGKVVKESIDVETKEVVKEIPIFGKTDKRVANLENGFVTYFNNAAKKYSKSLWLDGATELQKFARSYLDAIAVKEKLNISNSKDQTIRYKDIIDALKVAKIMSDDDQKFIESCLGKQYFQGEKDTQSRLSTAYTFMMNYQLYYYPEWCVSVKPQPFNGEATA